MIMPYEVFKEIVKQGIASGELKTDAKLSDFDLAVQWAIGNIGSIKGYPCDITPEEIHNALPDEFKNTGREKIEDSINAGANNYCSITMHKKKRHFKG